MAARPSVATSLVELVAALARGAAFGDDEREGGGSFSGEPAAAYE